MFADLGAAICKKAVISLCFFVNSVFCVRLAPETRAFNENNEPDVRSKYFKVFSFTIHVLIPVVNGILKIALTQLRRKLEWMKDQLR